MFENKTLFIIPVVCFVCIYVSYLRFRQLINPAALMTLWWGGWLFVSNLGIAGFYVPGWHIQTLVLIMLITYTLGTFFYDIPRKNITTLDAVVFCKKHILDKLYFLAFVCITPYFIKSLTIITLLPGTYRSAVFQLEEEDNVLFGNPYISIFFFKFLFPFLLLLTIISVIYFYIFNNKQYFFFTVLLTVMKSIMLSARTDIYYILFLILLSESFVRDKYVQLSQKEIKTRKNILIFLTSLFVITIILLSVFRLDPNGSYNIDVLEDVYYQFIQYHTQGFHLMSSELSNNSSFSSETITYGRATLGGLEDLFFTFIRRFGINYDTLSKVIGEYQIYNGTEIAPGRYIAIYYTMLFQFYLDGKELFVCLASGTLGCLTSYFYLDWSINRSLNSLFRLMLLLSTSLLSIFQFQMGVSFWMVLLYFALLTNINKKSSKLTV